MRCLTHYIRHNEPKLDISVEAFTVVDRCIDRLITVRVERDVDLSISVNSGISIEGDGFITPYPIYREQSNIKGMVVMMSTP